MGLIRFKDNIKEGEVFNKFLHNRMIVQNKNVLSVELGGTGSGKSYRDLRKAELWYEYKFKKKFPARNICFGVGDVLKRLSSNELKRGEVLIFEEAGANLGSLDFQNKISKMFTYVLQSFRSLNIAVFFNLPYLSMMNKQARMLLHYHSESDGIDHKKKQNRCKPFFIQVNQGTGKVYKKYLRLNFNGEMHTLKRMWWGMPSAYLVRAYELKKKAYLEESLIDYNKEVEELKKKKSQNKHEWKLDDIHKTIIKEVQKGTNQYNIAKMVDITAGAVSQRVKTLKKWGFI